MRNLHKKISVVVLAGSLLVGGVFSQGVVAYANSGRLLRDFEIEYPININDADKQKSDLHVEQGAKKYNYLIYISDVDNYQKDVIDDLGQDKLNLLLYLYPQLYFCSKYFKSGFDFQKYLNKYGMEKGLHKFWIGGKKYILLVPSDINPGIPYYDNKL